MKASNRVTQNEQKNIFEKISDVKQLIEGRFKKIDDEYLFSILSHIANSRYKKSRLSKDELIVYEILVKNSYNPNTVYRWLLLDKAPEEVKKKIANKEVSLRKASRLKTQQKKLATTPNKELIKNIIDCVERYIER